jgi:hypothetical protein
VKILIFEFSTVLKLKATLHGAAQFAEKSAALNKKITHLIFFKEASVGFLRQKKSSPKMAFENILVCMSSLQQLSITHAACNIPVRL